MLAATDRIGRAERFHLPEGPATVLAVDAKSSRGAPTQPILSPPTQVASAPGSPDLPTADVGSAGAPEPGLPFSVAGPDSQPTPPFATGPATRRAKTGPRRRTKVRPVFVVSLARSGSTLLRYLLDSHPQVVSPPELNLSALLALVVNTWIHADWARGKPADPGGPIPADILRRARRVADEVMQTIADDVGASVFCDKSLTTVDHLPLVQQCYPKATFVFLYRYPLDFIASGIEASQWGYSHYGFAPYIAGNLSNFVAGLGNYWIDRVSRMLNFEASCTAAHARLYYELLCDDPDNTLLDLLDLFDLEHDDSLLARTFSADHGRGPGDYKIDFTSGVSLGSIGRGSTLPQLLGPGQVTQMDELLAQLDYPSLESAWRGGLPGLLGLKSAKETAGGARRIAEQVKAAMQSTASTPVSPAYREFLPMELVVRAGTGDDGYLIVDSDGQFAVAEELPAGSTAERPRIRCAGDILLRVIHQDVTFGQAVRDGRIRFEQGAETTSPQDRPRRALAALAAVLAVRAAS